VWTLYRQVSVAQSSAASSQKERMQAAPTRPVNTHTIPLQYNAPWQIFGIGCGHCGQRSAVSLDMREVARTMEENNTDHCSYETPCPTCGETMKLEINKNSEKKEHKNWLARLLSREIGRD
jgi:phage terminase large subunit GpA-like protein